jgi:hypothetical protein
MALKPDKSGAELFKGVMLAHLILGLHLALFALIGLLVIFFGGIALYWGWILLGGLIVSALGADAWAGDAIEPPMIACRPKTARLHSRLFD